MINLLDPKLRANAKIGINTNEGYNKSHGKAIQVNQQENAKISH